MLVLQGISLFRRQNAHELQFQAKVVLAFTGIRAHFEPKGAVERRQVREPVRLEKRVRLEFAIFNFVYWTPPAGGMAKGRQVSRQETLESGRVEAIAKYAGGFSQC